MAKIKITEADRQFSLCVREAANWTCEYRGTQFEEGSQGLHCSHYFGRRAYSVRFDPDNAWAHSFWSHQHLGANPDEFTRWVTEQLGQGRLDILREKWNDLSLGKMIKKFQKDVSAHYRAEHKRLKQLRLDGATGKIEIIGFN